MAGKKCTCRPNLRRAECAICHGAPRDVGDSSIPRQPSSELSESWTAAEHRLLVSLTSVLNLRMLSDEQDMLDT